MKINSDNIDAHNQSIGNNSHVINGNNSTIEISYSLKTVTPSDIYKVCEILDGNLNENNDFIFDLNPDWLEKMEYNFLDHYKDIFEEYCIFYEAVEEVFRSTNINGTRLLRRINIIYKDILIENAHLNSDKIIKNVINTLKKVVEDSYEETTLTTEHIEDVILSVVFFAFTRCKVLEKPPFQK
ncbi:hypothetical protein R6U77_15535 [Lysinibacillus louembei]|uniref:Uncharacterized protein n=1 Tax=Lysinibacillus louembei TaxID=1470088 RepID=A0ABZ0RWS0_9BACI|nr:hypothetical protein [Lysinibacillus louembei]WPK11285.1 hypothetical protein R6U77_15535 [Lysinibacillus louembei]